MAEITAIKPQKRKGRYNVYVDGEFALGVSEEIVLRYDLKKGKEMDPTGIEQLVYKDSVEKLVDKSLRFLAHRPRSKQEIRNNLWKKIKKGKMEFGVELGKVIDKVMDRLKDLDLVDDEEFALWWVDQRIRFKPRGKLLLRKELFEKGLDSDVIKTVLSRYSDQQELEWAKKLYEKKESRYRHMGSKERKNKLSALLSRRGFSWDIVNRILESMD